MLSNIPSNSKLVKCDQIEISDSERVERGTIELCHTESST